jgi:hypothetical protein
VKACPESAQAALRISSAVGIAMFMENVGADGDS